MNIINSSTVMKSAPNEMSSLETECLFGEKVEILDKHLDWVYCKLETDNYCGWVQKRDLGKLQNPTHRILSKRSFIYLEKNAKSHCLFYIPMGANLVVDNIKSGWAEIILDIHNVKVGYVPSKHIVKLDKIINDWVAKAQQLEGAPYKWGGRDTIGLDCSGLLQLSYQTYGKSIPRNTTEQVLLEKKVVKNINDLKRGCVIFWERHVGIMIDQQNCIHANSFHMQTKTEPLSQIISRMGKKHSIIKMLNFN